jgi:hypothetical protein
MVRASARINAWLFSTTLSVQVGALVELYGQPFGGKAMVDLSVISFTIPFGEGEANSAPSSWSAFRESHLTTQPVALNIGRGGRATPEDESPGPRRAAAQSITSTAARQILIGTPSDLELVIDSAVPAKMVKLTFVGEFEDKAVTVPLPKADFGIRPMALAAANVESTLIIQIKCPSGSRPQPFEVEPPITNALPVALWGGSGDHQPALDGEPTVPGLCTGIRLAARVRRDDDPGLSLEANPLTGPTKRFKFTTPTTTDAPAKLADVLAKLVGLRRDRMRPMTTERNS